MNGLCDANQLFRELAEFYHDTFVALYIECKKEKIPASVTAKVVFLLQRISTRRALFIGSYQFGRGCSLSFNKAQTEMAEFLRQNGGSVIRLILDNKMM